MDFLGSQTIQDLIILALTILLVIGYSVIWKLIKHTNKMSKLLEENKEALERNAALVEENRAVSEKLVTALATIQAILPPHDQVTVSANPLPHDPLP